MRIKLQNFLNISKEEFKTSKKFKEKSSKTIKIYLIN